MRKLILAMLAVVFSITLSNAESCSSGQGSLSYQISGCSEQKRACCSGQWCSWGTASCASCTATTQACSGNVSGACAGNRTRTVTGSCGSCSYGSYGSWSGTCGCGSGLSWNSNSQSCQCDAGYSYKFIVRSVMQMGEAQAFLASYNAANNNCGVFYNWCKSPKHIGKYCYQEVSRVGTQVSYNIWQCLCGATSSFTYSGPNSNIFILAPEDDCYGKISEVLAELSSRGIYGIICSVGTPCVGTCPHATVYYPDNKCKYYSGGFGFNLTMSTCQ